MHYHKGHNHSHQKKKFNLSNKLQLIFSGIILILLAFYSFNSDTNFIEEDKKILEAEIIEASDLKIVEDAGGEFSEQELRVKITKGDQINRRIDITQQDLSASNQVVYKVGDKVQVTEYTNEEEESTYYISDFVRSDKLLLLFIIFVIAVVLVTKLQGLSSIIGMGFSFLVIFQLILPQILAGTNPVFISILGACLIIPITFFLSHGFNKKTSIAILGTLITLLITGIIASIFADISHLSGLSSEEASFLNLESRNNVNFQGLILAGIIISLLGILDDITISQSSIVTELSESKKNIKFAELFSRSMQVGKDHISSIVNTLVLAYTGASLPLLLLFIDQPNPFSEIINYEFLAEEIIQTLIGSIGLVLAVPITTLLACSIRVKKKEN